MLVRDGKTQAIGIFRPSPVLLITLLARTISDWRHLCVPREGSLYLGPPFQRLPNLPLSYLPSSAWNWSGQRQQPRGERRAPLKLGQAWNNQALASC